jgi:hypothetical protein
VEKTKGLLSEVKIRYRKIKKKTRGERSQHRQESTNFTFLRTDEEEKSRKS